jgi:dUTP pyrophosphatase
MVYYRLELVVLKEGLGYASIPERPDDNAGYDCYCAETIDLPASGFPLLVPLGIRARMIRVEATGEEREVHYWLAPRSSIYKKGIAMANSMGIIDRTYRGELKAPSYLHHPCNMIGGVQTSWGRAEQGERLFQIVAPDMGWIREVRIVDSLPDTVRGEGGFGSSGR